VTPRLLGTLLLLALGLELAQGFKYSALDPEAAVILPIVGPGDGTW
jgi:hypothetical protein